MNTKRIFDNIRNIIANWPERGEVAKFTVETVADWLLLFGHNANPHAPDARNISTGDAERLAAGDVEYQSLVKSFQRLDANYAGDIDGIAGPKTLAVMDLPRCGRPDYSAMQSLTAESSESNWRLPGCDTNDPERETVRSVRFFVDWSRSPLGVEYDREFLRQARECMAQMGLRTTAVYSAADADYTISWENIGGSTIGYYHVLQGRVCGKRLSGRLDIGYTPSDPLMFATLFVHEMWGHGIGHMHTRGGIMNPSIMRPNVNDGRPTWKGDPLESTMRRWFGGVPVSLEPGTTPDPDPDPDPDPPQPSDLEARVTALEAEVSNLKTIINELKFVDDLTADEIIKRMADDERFRGLQGFTGPQGEAGPRGFRGERGPTGPAGGSRAMDVLRQLSEQDQPINLKLRNLIAAIEDN